MRRIVFVNGFASFEGTVKYPVFDEFGTWTAKGPRSLVATWKVPTLRLEDSQLPLPDWTQSLWNIPVLSEAAVEALRDLLVGCAEILPIRVKGLTRSYFALNVTARNALDLEKSRFDMWTPTPGRIKDVTKVVFHPDLVADLMYQRGFASLYCSARFAKRAQSAKLAGFESRKELEEP